MADSTQSITSFLRQQYALARAMGQTSLEVLIQGTALAFPYQVLESAVPDSPASVVRPYCCDCYCSKGSGGLLGVPAAVVASEVPRGSRQSACLRCGRYRRC